MKQLALSRYMFIRQSFVDECLQILPSRNRPPVSSCSTLGTKRRNRRLYGWQTGPSRIPLLMNHMGRSLVLNPAKNLWGTPAGRSPCTNGQEWTQASHRPIIPESTLPTGRDTIACRSIPHLYFSYNNHCSCSYFCYYYYYYDCFLLSTLYNPLSRGYHNKLTITINDNRISFQKYLNIQDHLDLPMLASS